MLIRTVWGIYFSATGTTEKIVTRVAETAAGIMGAEYKVFSFNLPDARAGRLEFSDEDLVVIGVPVYAGRIPNVLLPFIKERIVGNGAFATVINLFGNRNYDDALIELRNIMQGNGFHTVSAGAFVGEHSFSRVLGAGRPDSGDIDMAIKLGKETAEKIQNLTKMPTEAVSVPGEEPIRPYYTPRDRHGNPINILKVKPKTDMSKCASCGVCSRICPMGSINPESLSEISGICIKCCACIKMCPAQAKYFDDEGYLYHKRELEELYERPARVELFY